MKCINCKRECGENPCGFHTERGYICQRCENAEIDTYTVKYPGMTDYVFKYKSDAESFIQEDVEADDTASDYEDYKIVTAKMKALEFYNLEEWDG